jgi:quercetin dioxygenase-like cupin family protein
MNAESYRWDDLDQDHPIALLTRRSVKGERVLVAQVKLLKGCHVKTHHHESEQISIMLSGKVVWGIGEEGTPDRREVPMTGGGVMVLPANVPHSVNVLEDAEFMDILSPIGPMGVDSQSKD